MLGTAWHTEKCVQIVHESQPQTLPLPHKTNQYKKHNKDEWCPSESWKEESFTQQMLKARELSQLKFCVWNSQWIILAVASNIQTHSESGKEAYLLGQDVTLQIYFSIDLWAIKMLAVTVFWQISSVGHQLGWYIALSVASAPDVIHTCVLSGMGVSVRAQWRWSEFCFYFHLNSSRYDHFGISYLSLCGEAVWSCLPITNLASEILCQGSGVEW